VRVRVRVREFTKDATGGVDDERIWNNRIK
jgi:hypothetical protein